MKLSHSRSQQLALLYSVSSQCIILGVGVVQDDGCTSAQESSSSSTSSKVDEQKTSPPSPPTVSNSNVFFSNTVSPAKPIETC
ncbi:hypothetical protein OUZ56_001243 [Daphnia magna]|uniref:Uncharacterized protein n=1 Tax=Daphnia magna TaxID=35525 RepID=A0ABR0A230_9CRUS|nr:hypothetical protein OUZ56_001243 [Daphnia magna]